LSSLSEKSISIELKRFLKRPTFMSNLDSRLQALSPAKRDLLLRKLRQTSKAKPADAGVEILPLISIPRHELMPLSLAQERIWFIEQLETTQTAYTVATAGYIDGNLSKACLLYALKMVVVRHEILRTTFRDMSGIPSQTISLESNVNFFFEDLRLLDISSKEHHLNTCIEKYTNMPFDLVSGPLHRVLLIRREDKRYLLFVAMHHIITDGWSLGVFFRDLTVYYNQLAGKGHHRVPPLSLQYADYASWQRSKSERGHFERDIEYWKECLEGATALLALPTDRSRQASASVRGATGSFSLSAQLANSLRNLAFQTESSLFMVTLAGFAALLNRYSRQDDIIIGTPVANRTMVELEELIGMFVNTLALRIRFTDTLSTTSFIHSVRSTVLDAFAHQDAPFEQVVDACVKERSLEHTPLFQVMFAFQNAPMPDTSLGDCLFAPVAVERNSTHFDLGFFLAEKDKGLEITYEYRSDLFHRASIQQICRYYVRLLEAMVAYPTLAIDSLPLLTRPEKFELMRSGTGPSREEGTDTSVITLFEQQCQSYGGRVAISGISQHVTYHDLNLRSNHIARILRERGVGPDGVVAVALERSADMIVAVVGILKAGGACLPVDLANPPERTKDILFNSDARLFLTSSMVVTEYDPLSAVGKGCVADVLLVDDLTPLSEEEGNPEYSLGSDDLVYVLYTSGSTGKPKGVAMPHRSLSNIVTWQLSEERFHQPAVTLQFSPLCFDVSFQEIFCTLCSGGTLVLIDEHIRKDSGAMLDVIERFDVERAFMPFVALQQLAITAVNTSRYPSSLRDVITAGEQLRITDPVRKFFENLPACRLHNQYGPTESHVVTALTLPDDVSTWPVLPSIGRPIANCAVYILERNMEPAPAGVPGELFIGGKVCARGYLNQPGLTSERFIPDPFNTDTHLRMYRSGDLARYLPDGSIECLGRVDHQVKIRGFRVELQEIESVLDCLQEVKECAVVVDDHHDGQPELAAYVVVHSDCVISKLRKKLAEKLPSYMVPRYLVPIEAMLLTPNGKIDRQALLRLERKSDISGRDGYPIRPTESMLCEIWARVLNLPMVKVDDNFFELGGHSLLATQLISEVNGLFSLALPIREIFDYPTVVELAERIDADNGEDEDDMLLSVSQSDNDRELLSYAQERLWIVEQSLGVSAIYNMPVALECAGKLDSGALQRAISVIIMRHETLRTLFSKDGDGRPQKNVLDTAECTFVRHDLTTLPEGERQKSVECIVHEEANTPFELEGGSLFRAGIVVVGPELHIIVFTFHHIICDGWSIGVFSRELSAVYAALVRGRTPALEPLALQYQDFALWQRRLLAGRRGDGLRNYWQKQLVAVPHLIDIPTDYMPPAVRENSGELLPFVLDHSICQGLHDLSRSQASTLFMTLLSAFSWLLFLYSGQERFLIGTPIANRNRKQFEPLIGFFVNMLPIGVDLRGDPTFIDIVQQIRGTCLDAYTHQDMPFDELVRLLRPERVSNRHPLVQVVFVLQNTPEPSLQLGDTILTPVRRDQTVAKYDLLMSLTQSNREIHGALEYSTELFSEATARGIVEMYTRLINTVLRAPQTRILDPDVSLHRSRETALDSSIDDICFDF
jgi:amino acid adenylation domain-containing protein